MLLKESENGYKEIENNINELKIDNKKAIEEASKIDEVKFEDTIVIVSQTNNGLDAQIVDMKGIHKQEVINSGRTNNLLMSTEEGFSKVGPSFFLCVHICMSIHNSKLYI